MTQRKFQPGFRLSMLDIGVLVASGVASVYALGIDRWFGLAIAFVVLHFFLFCNVLRMSRPLELIWAGIFAAMAVAAIFTGAWAVVLPSCCVATAIVAWVEMRRPSYHGVGWQRLNPHLPEWWRSTSVGQKDDGRAA